MAVPYHTHNFELPAATKQEVVAGIAVDKVVVPASLGSAAVEDVSAFATSEQGLKADRAVNPDRKIIAGNGLQGGGDFSEDRTLNLSEATLNALDKANDAASRFLILSPGRGLTGGGTLSDRSIEFSLNSSSLAAIAKAQTSVQPADLGALASKSKIVVADITASGTANNASFLRGDGSWATITASGSGGGSGGGDMTKSVYDPAGKNADAFNMDNMVAGTTNKIFTTSDKALLDNAAAKTVQISSGTGLTGGGTLSASKIELSLNATSIAAIAKAQTSVQPADLGALASKSKIVVADITASGTANSASFLRGDGSWATITASGSGGGSGGGDMTKSVYDPNNVAADIYDADNLNEGSRNLFLRTTERRAIVAILAAQRSLIGQIAFFPANNPPSGWLKANGALISRISYPDLWAFATETGAVVSESDWQAGAQGCFSYGTGEVSMFRIPDLRGEFLRSFDDGRGIDTGRGIGTAQGDAIRNITARLGSSSAVPWQAASGAFSLNNPSGFRFINPSVPTPGSILTFDASSVVPTADENRPRNIALLACIRY
ncbi:phage tail protein [Bartonella sp. HY406]|uniref:phage tail protein n=1 Tax=Bartonella sp. HY406 TaxID=2979331 RepID=UPI0021C8DE51|nr:tail fiber protein [Bartonella sp. HY406]UXN03114.1 tail fiber protein [Bartonella sp. HY406]